MPYSISRRHLIAGLSTGLLLPMSSCKTASRGMAPSSVFQHGVASGDPDHHSVILWTRISSSAPGTLVVWSVSEDLDFSNVIQAGEQRTVRDSDYTIKVLAKGLSPGKTYYYRFQVGDDISMIGRTKTLPMGHVSQLGIAVASCSNYPFGYFNAYEAIAEDAEVDLVLHLGDYLYEYAEEGWGADVGAGLNRLHLPANETVSLADYRLRHAQYKSDRQSQLMHAAHPLVVTWDDHESTNNPWMGGAQNHQPESEGDWATRRAASLQAYYEWMPIRQPGLGVSREQYWRHFQFGDLASLITLETRHTGRSKQIDYPQHFDLLRSDNGREKFLNEVLGAPERAMLSGAMRDFLQESIAESIQSERRWRIIGNQIPMARTHVPAFDFAAIVGGDLTATKDPLSQEMGAMAFLSQLNLPIYLDTWDGYPAAREDFYQICARAGAEDLIVLTGDSHAFWQSQLFDGFGKSMGVELGTTGITSPGDFLRFGANHALALDRALADHNTEVLWTDNRYNGYIRLTLNHEQARADFVAVSTVLKNDYHTNIVRTRLIQSTGGKLSYQS